MLQRVRLIFKYFETTGKLNSTANSNLNTVIDLHQIYHKSIFMLLVTNGY